MFKFPATSDERMGVHGREHGERFDAAVFAASAPEEGGASVALLEALRQHAASVLATCLDAEVNAYVTSHARPDKTPGSPLVVRNGFQPVRPLSTSIGPVDVRPPKVRARMAGIRGYRSILAPRYVRRASASRAGADARYLHAFTRGNWPLLLADLLAMPGETVFQLPTSRLESGWVRGTPGLAVRTISAAPDSAVEGASFAFSWPSGHGAAQVVAAVVARGNSGSWQLLASSIAEGSRESAIIALHKEMIKINLSSELTAALSNTKIDVVGTQVATFGYKY